MASTIKVRDDNVDYRLLNRLSNLVICCRCLRQGKVTPVPQVISDRHKLTNECPDCRQDSVSRYSPNRALGKVLTLAR